MAWAPKRFWQEARAVEAAGGFAVQLDGRPLRTPAKAQVLLPTRALAEAVAAEWQAVEGEVNPARMPLTRAANSAIDTIPRHRAAIVADLAGYGGSDLICYRSEGPAALVARQAAGWDPLLAWAASLGAPLATGPGVVPVPQPAESLAVLKSRVEALADFELAGFHDLVTVTGSLVIALAIAAGRLTPEEGFALSRIDEHWQRELWGEDAEAAEAEAAKRDALLAAARFLGLCRVQDR